MLNFWYFIRKSLNVKLISKEVWVYLALDAPIKFRVLKLRNVSGRSRRLSAMGYLEWLMGDQRSKSSMHVFTEVDPNSEALFAHNLYNTEFSARVAFFKLDVPATSKATSPG